MPTYTVAIDKGYTFFLNVNADNAEEAENLVNDMIIADTFDDYLVANPPAKITNDGFGNPTVLELDNA